MHPLSISSFSKSPTPLVEILPAVFTKNKIRLFVKRDDMIHPSISGNKWRKLKHNLLEAGHLGFSKLMTFGGAYSNHLAATAAAGKEFGFETLGIVRGERIEPLNPTLQFVEANGMRLKFVSRTEYRKKSDPIFFENNGIDQSGYYILPEGGSNCLALPGVSETVSEITSQLGHFPDYLCAACGTGGTLSGLISGMSGQGQVLGFPVLKGDFMKEEVSGFLKKCVSQQAHNWLIFNDYHFGGYAKHRPELIDFINDFKLTYNIPLDPIYTGKMAYGVFDLAAKGFFKKGSTVVILHTGGLQGVAGFNERFGGLV